MTSAEAAPTTAIAATTAPVPVLAAPSQADLHEIIYVSTIADSAPLRVVADIAAASRQSNLQAHITGVLIFDGMHFCQQLEGNPASIQALMQRIRQDPRHSRVSIVHQGPLPRRRFGYFNLGFTLVEDVEVLEQLQWLRGEEAVEAFLALLPHLDLGS